MNQLKTLTVIILVCLTFSTISGAIGFVKACGSDPASKIVFSAGAPQVLQAGTISNQITVQLRDGSNDPVNALSDTTVNLATTASSSGHFYSDINGINQISVTTIKEGQNSGNFYYNDTLAGHPTLTASSGTLTPASTTFTINPGSASKLFFSAGGSQTLTVGQVSPTALIVERQDQYSNPTTLGGSITISLSTSSNGNFYSDAAGTSQITQININAAVSDSTGFYYVDTTAGNPTLTAQLTGLTSATTIFTIIASSDSMLVYTSGVPQSLTAGGLSGQVTVQRQDSYGDPITSGSSTILLSSTSAGGIFYSDAGSTVVSSITINSGSSAVSFWYDDLVAGFPTLTAASTGMTSASTVFTITGHMAATSIAITPETASITAGASQAFTAAASDGYNNWDVTGSVAWSIDAAAGGSWVQSTGTYTSVEAGIWTVTGVYNGLTATASLTVSPAGLDHITASVSPSLVAAPGLVTGTATAYDSFGNSWDISSLAVWSIPAGGDGGSWSGNVYTSNTAGTYAVQAEYLGMIATASLTVTHATDEAYLDHIVIAPKEATVAAGVSQSYTTTAYDTFGNSWAVAAAYSCPSSDVIISGNSAYSNVAGTYSVTATYSGLTDTATLTTTGYAVTFAETGLPTGTSWNVTFGGNVYFSTTNAITINGAPAQSYPWSTTQSIGNSQTQYVANEASGTLAVPSQLTQNIQYTTQYLVTYAATGNVLSVSVPANQWVNSGGQATGLFPSQVENGAADTRCNFVSDNRASITQPTTVTATYQTQYYLTVNSPFSSTMGSGWYNSGSTADASVASGIVSEGTGVREAFIAWSGDASGTAITSSVTMTGPKTATASWNIQYLVTYAAAGNALTVTLPSNEWVNYGASAQGKFTPTISNSAGDTQCLFQSDNRPATITKPITITGNYLTKYKVTFNETGILSDAKGTILAVLGVPEDYSQLASVNWVNTGATVTFTFNNSVDSTTANKAYALISVNATSPLTITAPTMIIGNYEPRYSTTLYTILESALIFLALLLLVILLLAMKRLRKKKDQPQTASPT